MVGDFCPEGCYWECEHRAPLTVEDRLRRAFEPSEATLAALEEVRTDDRTTYVPTRPQTIEAINREVTRQRKGGLLSRSSPVVTRETLGMMPQWHDTTYVPRRALRPTR